jgi:hypothetical protein
MDNILEILSWLPIFVIAVSSFCTTIILYSQFEEMKTYNNHSKELIDLLERLAQNSKIDQEPKPIPPMKPNNWDSVRDAFRAPVRSYNERA